MKVAFNQLPPRVQEAITTIRKHRRQMSLFGSVFTALFAGGSVPFLSPFSGILLVPLTAMVYPLYPLLKSHDPQFREEYLRLFHALKDNRNSPILKPLFNNPKSNYLKVNRDGSLEVGYKTPRKFLGVPIGRRQVVKPNAPKGIRNKWKRSIEYRTELTRQRRRK